MAMGCLNAFQPLFMLLFLLFAVAGERRRCATPITEPNEFMHYFQEVPPPAGYSIAHWFPHVLLSVCWWTVSMICSSSDRSLETALETSSSHSFEALEDLFPLSLSFLSLSPFQPIAGRAWAIRWLVVSDCLIHHGSYTRAAVQQFDLFFNSCLLSPAPHSLMDSGN